jgi:DNA polymerase-4
MPNPPISPFITQPKKRVILHVDGDAFFASCEQALNPRFLGKPVVTGEERGIVSSMSYEAKALRVTRGMPIWQLRRDFPNVVVMSSHFDIYEKFSDHIANILAEFTPVIERYSIDEAFADLTGWDKASGLTPREIAAQVQSRAQLELGIGVSIGVASSKVLAKVGSKHNKPRGLVEITENNRETILGKTQVGHIWGIGPRLAKKCMRYNIFNAADFANQSFDLVRARFSAPVEELWHELRGTSVMPVHTEHDEKKSLTRSHTFHPASSDFTEVYTELLGNLDRVLLRTRRRNMLTKTISIFLKSQDFEYHTATRELAEPSAFTNELAHIIASMCREAFHKNTKYRATGVTVSNLVSAETRQHNLFTAAQAEKRQRLYSAIDTLGLRHGRNIIKTGAETRKNSITSKKKTNA